MLFNSSSKHVKIKSRKKNLSHAIDFSTRVISEKETLAKLIPVCKQIGITRVSDITYLDRLYLPNYSAFLPGTGDSIWVYGGKGPTKLHAKVSALMEAVERYSSFSDKLAKCSIRGSYSQLSETYNKVLHPDEVLEPQQNLFDENSMIDYLPGLDILRKEDVLVPTQLVLSRYFPAPPAVSAFQYSHTNGLAAGNVIEEAICHAICELIERDAVSIADLCTSAIPYTILEKISMSLQNKEDGTNFDPSIFELFVDDSSLFNDVDVSEIDWQPVRFLLNRFEERGIPLIIKDITMNSLGIPTFIASSPEWLTYDYGLFARGYGCHPDSRVALVRALTELSQTRAANIQGAREDLSRIIYRHNNDYSKRWQFVPTTLGLDKVSATTVKFSEIKTYCYEDVLSDIKIILDSLRKAGIKRVIVVDVTNQDIGIPVVRAIIPGLETFEIQKLFKRDDLLIGQRAKSYFSEILRPNLF